MNPQTEPVEATNGRAVAVFLLGGFRVAVDGVGVDRQAWQQRRATDLVKLLALAPRHRLHREQVLETLWPELESAAAAANLRKAVHYARRALGFEEAIDLVDGMLELAPGATVSVDVDLFEREALAARRTGNPKDAAGAIALHTGELLPEDVHEPWLDDARERVRRQLLLTLRTARLWERIIDVDPVNEDAHRALMRADLDAGDRQGALRRFERLRETLRTELGIGPDARTLELYREVLGRAAEVPVTPAERTASLLGSALMALHRGDLGQAETDAVAARELAVQAELGRAVGEASGLLGMVAHMQGKWAELFLREFVDAVKRPTTVGAYVFDAHTCLAEFWLFGADGISRGITMANELLGIAEKHGSLHGRAVAQLILGEAALMSDRLNDAETHLAASIALYQEAGALSGWAIALGRLAEVGLARNDHVRTARILPRLREVADRAPLSSHIVSRVFEYQIRASQHSADAMRAVRDAEEVLSSQDVCESCSMGFRVASAIACARAGELDAAASYTESARRVAGMWQRGPAQAAEWEARAALRLAEGNHRQAAALLHEAADLYAKSGHVRSARRCRAEAEAPPPEPAARNVSGTPAP